MQTPNTLVEIEKEIERLSPNEQLRLVEKLAHHLRKSGLSSKKKLGWKNLYGLGKRLWKEENAQEYVNRMRDDR